MYLNDTLFYVKMAFLINFRQKYLFLYVVIAFMTRVLERIRWPQMKRVVGRYGSSASRVNLRFLELKAAKEILAEIFGSRSRMWR
jgi:hypothetical protein